MLNVLFFIVCHVYLYVIQKKNRSHPSQHGHLHDDDVIFTLTLSVLMIRYSGSYHESVLTQMRQAVSTVNRSRGLFAPNILRVG